MIFEQILETERLICFFVHSSFYSERKIFVIRIIAVNVFVFNTYCSYKEFFNENDELP